MVHQQNTWPAMFPMEPNDAGIYGLPTLFWDFVVALSGVANVVRMWIALTDFDVFLCEVLQCCKVPTKGRANLLLCGRSSCPSTTHHDDHPGIGPQYQPIPSAEIQTASVSPWCAGANHPRYGCVWHSMWVINHLTNWNDLECTPNQDCRSW